MKTYKFILIIPIILVAVIYFACDDSGFTPSNLPRGLVSFTQKNLKHIDPNIDGVFELWLRVDSQGTIINYSLGRFNINEAGMMTDTSGGTIEFKFQGDTNNLGYSKFALVTVEPPGDYNNQPSELVLLSGETGIKFDSLYATLKLSGSLALGSAGQQLLAGSTALVMLAAPTSGLENCFKGVWFCDTLQNAGFPPGLLITSQAWVYEGWIVDKSVPGSPVYYSTGRFRDPYGPDYDGAGPCAGPGTPYLKPGQDWIQDNCPLGLPKIEDLGNGKYEVFVTLEPAYETPFNIGYDKPFFLQLYKQPYLPNFWCRRSLYFVSLYTMFPEARLRITY